MSNLKVNSIQHTNGTNAITIDSNGYLLRSSASFPAFHIANFNWSTTINRPHNGDVFYNQGNNWNSSTGIFTSPVSGYYYFTCTVQGHSPGSTAGRNGTYFNLTTAKNGAGYGGEIVATCQESNGSKHDQITHSAVVYLSVNDTFYFYSNYGYRPVQNVLCGFLLG